MRSRGKGGLLDAMHFHFENFEKMGTIILLGSTTCKLSDVTHFHVESGKKGDY